MYNYINNNICEDGFGVIVFFIFFIIEYEIVYFFMFLSNGWNLFLNVVLYRYMNLMISLNFWFFVFCIDINNF